MPSLVATLRSKFGLLYQFVDAVFAAFLVTSDWARKRVSWESQKIQVAPFEGRQTETQCTNFNSDLIE